MVAEAGLESAESIKENVEAVLERLVLTASYLCLERVHRLQQQVDSPLLPTA